MIDTDLFPPIIVIAGTTASGKSSLALKLAKIYDGIIINADSRQVYKEISIGTAKPVFESTSTDGNFKVDYLDGIKHYLYDYVSIFDEYNVGIYKDEVYSLLDFLRRTGTNKTILLVGGTGLYIDSVVNNYSFNSNQDKNTNREELNLLGVAELQEKIEACDLNKLNNSDKNNPRRLIRIIEKQEFGEQDISKLPPLTHLYLNLDRTENNNSEIIDERIKDRIEIMFGNSLIEEVTKFKKEIVEDNLPALQTLAYQEFKPYFEGSATIAETKEAIYTHTRQYAKRQRTWFRKKNQIKTITNLEEARLEIDLFSPKHTG